MSSLVPYDDASDTEAAVNDDEVNNTLTVCATGASAVDDDVADNEGIQPHSKRRRTEASDGDTDELRTAPNASVAGTKDSAKPLGSRFAAHALFARATRATAAPIDFVGDHEHAEVEGEVAEASAVGAPTPALAAAVQTSPYAAWAAHVHGSMAYAAASHPNLGSEAGFASNPSFRMVQPVVAQTSAGPGMNDGALSASFLAMPAFAQADKATRRALGMDGSSADAEANGVTGAYGASAAAVPAAAGGGYHSISGASLRPAGVGADAPWVRLAQAQAAAASRGGGGGRRGATKVWDSEAGAVVEASEASSTQKRKSQINSVAAKARSTSMAAAARNAMNSISGGGLGSGGAGGAKPMARAKYGW